MEQKKEIHFYVKKIVSEKEIEIVQLLADGNRPKDIAEKKSMNNRTVEAQIANLKKKFMVNSPAGLIILFYRNKLII